MKTKKIYIKGMHCASCEKLLNDEFRNVPGVKDVRVDRKSNTAEIDYEESEPNFEEIKKTARKFGYDALETRDDLLRHSMSQSGKTDWTEWFKAILIVAALLVGYRIFQNLGLIDKINLRSSEITLGISFLIGLVASISTCLAVVGAVVITFGEKYKSEGKSFYQSAVKPNLLFHIGRLATFFVLGGMLGLIGGEINISGNFISVFTMVIAVVMAWLGLHILGLLPSISDLGIRMPDKMTKNWDKLKRSEHKAAPFLLGGLSFFLPCGFMQSVQIFALASGSFWAGALSLFLFALGTMPSLLALGITVSWTKQRKMAVWRKVAGFLILFFAIFTLQSGLALKGVRTNVLGNVNKNKETVAENDKVASRQEEQVVEMRITYQGFQPNVLTVKKGVPVKWVIKGDQVTSCTNRIVIPSLNIAKNISSGENVIRFTPAQKGEIPFSCWMGMVRGKFVVD